MKRLLILTILLSLLTSCQQEEFYEKDFLEGSAVIDNTLPEIEEGENDRDPSLPPVTREEEKELKEVTKNTDPTEVEDLIENELTDIPLNVEEEESSEKNPPEIVETEEPKKEDPIVVETEEPKKEDPIVVETEEPKKEDPIVVETEEPKKEDTIVVETEEPKKEDPIVVETEEPKKEDPIIIQPEAPINNNICGDLEKKYKKEIFTQNKSEKSKVDILWIVDNSGSMRNEQESLAENFEAFIGDFIKKDVDFQMAITTTDPSRGIIGRRYHNPKLLTSIEAKKNERKFIRNFQHFIKVGTKGSGHEAGLLTSLAFLKRYPTYLREDAYLIIVYISDEEDHSRGQVKNWVNEISKYKKNKGLVKAYSIVTTSKETKTRYDSVGSRYMEASRLTAGGIADIHNSFYKTLTNFGGKILNLIDSFPLSSAPIADTVSVKVNADPSAQWNFISSSRTVKFQEGAIPSEGSQIEITYDTCE